MASPLRATIGLGVADNAHGTGLDEAETPADMGTTTLDITGFPGTGLCNYAHSRSSREIGGCPDRRGSGGSPRRAEGGRLGVPNDQAERGGSVVPPRRSFLKTVAGAGLATAAFPRRVMGANDRVRVGVIGVGLIGKRHLLDFLAEPDCEVAAICEVYPPRLEEGLAMAGGRASPARDFRRLLDRQDIDAVIVSVPDHWHAPMTILACAAGKDVYVEKPLTHVVREGRWMVQAARHYGRVVQVGTQQRSGAHYKRCVDLIRNGHIGEVRSVRLAARRNVMPGFTRPAGRQPLSPEDWDMWLRPAPYVPFEPTPCIYHLRWFWDYSSGQNTKLPAPHNHVLP